MAKLAGKHYLNTKEDIKRLATLILGAGQKLNQYNGKIDHILKNSQIFWRWLSEGGRNTGIKGISVTDEIDIQIRVRIANDKGLTRNFGKTNTLWMSRGL